MFRIHLRNGCVNNLSFTLTPGASLVVQTVKNLPAMWETQVLSLGWEDPLEKGMAIHSNILAWKIPWTVQSLGPQNWTRLRHFHFIYIVYVMPSLPIYHSPSFPPGNHKSVFCICDSISVL